MSQMTKKERIEELKRKRSEITKEIQFLEKEATVFGRVKIDDSGIAIYCENRSYSKKTDFWRSVIVKERRERESDQVVERSDEEMKESLASLIKDLQELYEFL